MKIDQKNTLALLQAQGFSLAEPGNAHTHRLYLAFANDTDHACLTVTAYNMDHSKPRKVSERVNPILGIHNYQANNIAGYLEIPADRWKEFRRFCRALNRFYEALDATSLEMAPLLLDADGFSIASAHMSVDENALFRQPEIVARLDANQQDETQSIAILHKLNYVRLEGQIGCMANGAGLAMTLIDAIAMHGRDAGISAANFMDIGGGAKAERIRAGLDLLLSDPTIDCIIINVFGGITRCDELAQIIIHHYQDAAAIKPIVLRLQGTNAERAMEMVQSADLAGIYIADSLSGAVRQAIQLIREGRTA